MFGCWCRRLIMDLRSLLPLLILGLCLSSWGCARRGPAADGASPTAATRPKSFAPLAPDPSQPDQDSEPTLRLRFDREAGLLEGRWPSLAADADSNVALDLEGQSRRAVPLNADGSFVARYEAEQLRGGLEITVSLTTASSPEGFEVHRVVPQVRVSLHPGDIVGTMAPASRIAIRLSGSGGELGSGESWSNESGRFSAWIYDAEGRRLRPRPGQEIRIDDGQSPIEFTIPALSAAWSLDANRIAGRGLAGAAIDLTMWNPWRPGETETPTSRVDADGAWRIGSEHGLHPATHFYITEHLPSGDQLYLCQQIPMLYVEPGSALVEVQTLWETLGRLELEREGRVVARAEGGGPWSGNLQLVLSDAAGMPVAVEAGDRLDATLEDPDTATSQRYRLRVEPLASRFDAAAGAVLVSAPSWAKPALAEPERPMDEPAAVPDGLGTWRFDLGERLTAGGMPAPGQRFDLYYPLAEGHNMRRRFIGLSLNAVVGGRTISGSASPMDALRVTRLAQDGQRTGIDAQASISGSFRIDLPKDQATIVAGDRLRLESASEALELAVWDLDANWEADGRSLSGTARPAALIEIEAWMQAQDPPLRMQTTADEQGNWRMNLVDRGSGLAGVDPNRLQRLELQWSDGPYALRKIVTERPRP
jgi:hypothetical protein